jgi:hypothetical protein
MYTVKNAKRKEVLSTTGRVIGKSQRDKVKGIIVVLKSRKINHS